MTNATPANKLTLSNQAYNVLKFIALVLLPALGTLYFAIAQIWDIPGAEQVVGTIVVVDTFLGGVLGISSSNYNKNTAENQGANADLQTDGALVIDTVNPNKDTYSFEVDTPLDEIASKDTITLRVKSNTGEITDELKPEEPVSE